MTPSSVPSAPDLADRDCRPVGVWTAIRPATWTAEAYRRVYEREILARLPGARVRFVGDVCDDAVAVSERGDVITSLASRDDGGPAIEGLVAAGLGMIDLAAFSRGIERPCSPPAAFILSALSVADAPIGEREAAARAIAAALDVSVRDAPSLDRVRALRTDGSIAMVPDPLVLFPRLTAPRVAQSRIEYLRTMDRYPIADTVIVEVSAARTGHLPALGQHVADAVARGYRISVVALPVEGESMTDEMRRSIERAITKVHCLDRLTLEDLAAVIATSAAVVPLSPALLAAACAFGRPSLWCAEAAWERGASIDTALPGADRLIHEEFGALLNTPLNPAVADPWRAQLDSHFDFLAERLSTASVGASQPTTIASGRLVQLEAAQRVTGRRLADERLRFAERAEGLIAEIARLKSELARRTVLEAALRQETADALAHARHEGSRLELRRQREWQLESTVNTLQAENATMRDQLGSRAEAIAALQQENAARAAAIAALQHENAARADAIVALQQENTARAENIADLVRQRDEYRAAVDRFARSRSWRYLAPARAIGRMLRKLLGIRT